LTHPSSSNSNSDSTAYRPGPKPLAESLKRLGDLDDWLRHLRRQQRLTFMVHGSSGVLSLGDVPERLAFCSGPLPASYQLKVR
jgi:hypothetical protein